MKISCNVDKVDASAPAIGPIHRQPRSTAAAAMYSLAVSAFLYRTMSWRDAYHSLLTSARMTASISL